jgi:ABC-2 type transport system ATP-binding protein
VDAIEGEGGVSKWRISWETARGATGAASTTASDTAASQATCDAVLRIVLAHAEVRAVLSLHDAVETRLLAALAPNDPLMRRRA